MIKDILALLVIALGVTGCALSPPVRHTKAVSNTFLADAFFVLEFEHDPTGNLVHAAAYGPTDSEFKATQDVVVRKAKVHEDNPSGFDSQFTVQHVRFTGPLGPRGAVITQPIAINRPVPKSWVLFATDFDKHGAYLGSEMLHETALALTCQHDARDVIDSTPRSDTEAHAVPSGSSLLIYCVPVPPLPTSTTLPNGDSIV